MDYSSKIKFGVRIAAVVLIILFFVPTISVSCSDYEAEFSAFDAAVGNVDEIVYEEMGLDKSSGDEGIDPAPLLFVLIIIAAIILKFSNDNAIVSSVCAAASAVVMYIFKSGAKDEAVRQGSYEGYNMVKVDTTSWFTIHIIVCLGIIAVLMYEKYVLQVPENHKKVKNTVDNILGNNGPSTTATNMITCAKCGNKVPVGTKFCRACGNDMQPPRDEKRFCSNCGHKQTADEVFCPNCGNKY